jgi:ketosteroid isomerase-like protein
MSITFGFSQNKQQLESINQNIWQNFTKAFEIQDANLFESLHAENLIRITGDGKRIRTKSSYIDGYKQRWANTNNTQTIAFRFLERISNETHASERGIYKLTVNKGLKNEKSYYGKFHVLLQKITNVWKIIVDYDSSENNTINETSFQKAYAIDDYEKY